VPNECGKNGCHESPHVATEAIGMDGRLARHFREECRRAQTPTRAYLRVPTGNDA
jgi:hypothetical protein